MRSPDPRVDTPDSPAAHRPPPRPLQGLAIETLLNALPQGLVAIDSRNGQVLHLNREAERLLSLGAVAWAGRPATELLPAELAGLCSAPRWQQLRMAGRVGAEPSRLELALGPRWVQVQRSLLSVAGGHAEIGLLSLQDCSARRQLERALQESDTRFRQVTDSVSECLFVTSSDWDRLHFSSPLLLDTLGLSPLDLREGPRAFEQRIHEQDRPLYQRRLVAQAQGEASDMVLRIEHPQRGLRWVRLRTRPQLHADGQSLVYGILVDVTEEQQQQRALQLARDQAEAASQAKSAFMATMSHELRTPMNGILGMTQLLQDSTLNASQRGQVGLLLHSAEALQHLLDDLLDVAQLDGQAPAQAPEGCELRTLLQELAAAGETMAQARGLSLTLTLAPDLPQTLPLHGPSLRRLLSKLLDNAVKFTERGGVELCAQRIEATGGPALLIELKDTGIGLPTEALPRLFKAFTQAQDGLSRRYGGTGVGLAIAQRLSRQLGAQLSAAPRAGGGSVFSLLIPLQDLGPQAASPMSKDMADSRQTTSTLTGKRQQRVLVVEDNRVNQEVIRQMLEQLGCAVRLSDDAHSGLQALCEDDFDLVMMDIQMPGMDGMEALSVFRQRDASGYRFVCSAATPVVAVTANALEGDEQRLRRHGFDDYLPKPIRQPRLLQMLQRQLHRPATPEDPAPAMVDLHHPDPDRAASAMNASAGHTVLDEASLSRLRELDPGGKNQLLTRVVGAYLKSLDKLLPDLQQARAAGMDLAAIRHVAHTLKSSSASLGALDLSAQCADIENLARNGQTEGLDKMLDAMHDEVARVRDSLNALLTGPQ